MNRLILLPGTAGALVAVALLVALFSGENVAPINTNLPAVTGTAETGETLTCSPGTWLGEPDPSYAYTWQRDAEPIDDATSSTYTLVEGDVDEPVRCVVTASNTKGDIAAVSATVTPGDPSAPGTANIWMIASSPDGDCDRSAARRTLAATISAGDQCNNGDNVSGALKAACVEANTGDVIGIDDTDIFPSQTLNGCTKTLEYEGDPEARPMLRQIVMDDTSANLTFRHLDLSRSASETNPQATWSNGTGSGSGSDNINLVDVNISSNYVSGKTAFFDEGSSNSFTDVDVCCTVDEKLGLIGGDHLTFTRVDWHDLYVTSELVHSECLYNGGSDYLLIDSNHFYRCQTINLQNSRYCGAGGGEPDVPVHDVTLRNSVFEHTIGGIGIFTISPWHSYSIGWVGNGLSCSDDIPAGDPIIRWTVVNNTIETTTPVPTDIECVADGGDPCVFANNIGAWSCGDGWVYSHNVGTDCGGDGDDEVNPASSTESTPAAFDWADPSAHDFHLETGSPAIGVCDETYAPTLDADGVTRGETCDAGAYEYGG